MKGLVILLTALAVNGVLATVFGAGVVLVIRALGDWLSPEAESDPNDAPGPRVVASRRVAG